MAVKRRGRGFQADITVSGKRHRELFEDETAAHGWIADVKAALANGRDVPRPKADEHGSRSSGITLQRACDQCFQDVYSRSKSAWPETVQLYFNVLCKAEGPSTPIADIATPVWLTKYTNSLYDAGNAQSTVNGKLSVVSRLFRWAFENRYIKANPKVERKPANNERQSYLTHDEEAVILRLARQWEKADEADAITMLVDTGMRSSELWRLAGTDVSRDLGETEPLKLYIRTSKTGKPREVYATPRVREIVLRRRTVYGLGQLFPGMDNRRLRGVWDRIRVSMGRTEDKDFVPYILRHTCASRLVQNGIQIGVVMRWLGHKNIQMTMRYAKYAPADFMAAAAALAKPRLVEKAP